MGGRARLRPNRVARVALRRAVACSRQARALTVSPHLVFANVRLGIKADNR
jgi:hypothetical protein